MVLVYLVYCFFFCFFCVFFVFQAEDGIRDLVRSRGLGDVYKRQAFVGANACEQHYCCAIPLASNARRKRRLDFGTERSFAVSYTHLTLPTSDLV